MVNPGSHFGSDGNARVTHPYISRTGNPQYAGWLNEQFGLGKHFRGEYIFHHLLCETDTVGCGMKQFTLLIRQSFFLWCCYILTTYIDLLEFPKFLLHPGVICTMVLVNICN
jgi:hypothetical protein